MTSEPGPASSWDPEQVVRLHGEMQDDRAEATIFRDQQPTLHLAQIMQIAGEWGISSTIKASRRVRSAARSIREALDGGHKPEGWAQIVRRTVRDAPLPSLLVAFLLGVIVARS